MYRVLDVSRFIINYCYDKDYNLSNLKLQKILYFIQAYYVSKTDNKEPCFSERIEAWDFGPVVPLVYREYKQFGSTNIPKISCYVEFDEDDIWESKVVQYNDEIINKFDKDIISILVDEFSKYSTTKLVSITHRQTPWMEAYEQGRNNEITVEAIRRYFNGA